MTIGRHREQTLLNETSTFNQVGTYSTPSGTCTTSPGPCTKAWTNTYSGSYQSRLQTKVMDDTITTGWRKKIANGEILNNPMKITEVDQYIPNVNVYARYFVDMQGCTPVRKYHFNEHLVTGTRSLPHLMTTASVFKAAPGLVTDDLKSIAVTKAWANITHAEILSLAAIAELDQSVVGLIKLLKKAWRIFNALSRFRLRSLKKELTPKELKDLYLEARYNLRPLYYDTNAILKLLYMKDKKPKRQTFRGYVYDEETSHDVISKVAVSHSNYCIVSVEIHRNVMETVTVRSGVLTESERVLTSQLWGFDALVDTAWELVPFSFILDWFLNVGDTISSWVPDFGINPLTSWVTIERNVTQTTTVGNMTVVRNDGSGYYMPLGTYSVSAPMAYCCTRTKERIPDPQRSVIPRWNLNLNPLKLLDLALICTDLRKIRTSRY